MQEREITVYPYVNLNHDGTVSCLGGYSFAMKDEVTDYNIRIALEPVTMKVQVPEEDQLIQGTLALLGVEREKVQRELQGKLIFLEQLKNGLLRLEHADVLDAVNSDPAGLARETHLAGHDEGDDIPF